MTCVAVYYFKYMIDFLHKYKQAVQACYDVDTCIRCYHICAMVFSKGLSSLEVILAISKLVTVPLSLFIPLFHVQHDRTHVYRA